MFRLEEIGYQSMGYPYRRVEIKTSYSLLLCRAAFLTETALLMAATPVSALPQTRVQTS